MFAHQLSFVAAALALAGMVNAHGMITSPTPRQPGAAFKAACGEQVFNQLSSDPFGNQQGEQQNQNGFTPTADCKLYQCKGLQFSDNVDLVQSYPAGTVVPMTITIRAPHTGVANVSIISTTDNRVLAGPLVSFDPAYSNAVPLDQQTASTQFDITIPDLAGQCATAGDCAIQWWWDARSIDQTYMSCIDFTQGGASAPAPSTSTAASSTAVPEPVSSTVVADPTSSVEEVTSSAAPAPTSSAEVTSSAAPAPTTSAEVTTSAAPEPTTSAEEVTTSVAAPTSSSVAPSAPLSAPASTFSGVRPSSSSAAPTVGVPTTSASPTTSTAVSAPTGATDPNVCWRIYNKCLDASQPHPDFAGCSQTRDACISGARAVRLARSGTIGRRV